MAITRPAASPDRRWQVVFVVITAVAAIVATAGVSHPVSGASPIVEEPAPQAELDRSAISRLYFAAFDRPADLAGLDYWHQILDDGASLDAIADYFVSSTEFSAKYGEVDHAGLVSLIYQNVLRRPADQDGLRYWVGLLDAGHSPGTILNGFAQSPEFDVLTRAQPAAEPAPAFPESVLMIGDSIFHGIRILEIPIGTANVTFMTEEGRHVAALPELLSDANSSGAATATDLTIIHLGTNGWLPEYDMMFDAEIAALAPRPVLVVNTKVDRVWESTANDRIADVAARHDHVDLVDWNRHVARHPNWMRADGVHPNRLGLNELARLITERIEATVPSARR